MQEDPESQSFLGEGYNNKERQQNDKNNFICKVYGILSCQIAITTVMCAFSTLHDGFRLFCQDNVWLMWVCFVLAIIIEIAIFCFPQNARNFPTNYILLFA